MVNTRPRAGVVPDLVLDGEGLPGEFGGVGAALALSISASSCKACTSCKRPGRDGRRPRGRRRPRSARWPATRRCAGSARSSRAARRRAATRRGGGVHGGQGESCTGPSAAAASWPSWVNVRPCAYCRSRSCRAYWPGRCWTTRWAASKVSSSRPQVCAVSPVSAAAAGGRCRGRVLARAAGTASARWVPAPGTTGRTWPARTPRRASLREPGGTQGEQHALAIFANVC
jgi:hypothetical protein